MIKQEFTIKVGDEEQVYVVKMPDEVLRKQARELKLDFFRKNLFKENCVFSNQVLDVLKTKGLWSDDKEKQIKQVSRDIEEKVRLLQRGKTDLVPTKDILRKIIIEDVKPLRTKQLELLSERSQLDGISIESESQQLEIDYLVSKSTFTKLDDPVFTSLDDYKVKSNENYAELAARNLSELIGLINKNWFQELPENKLLIKYGFMNDKGQYIDADGNLIREDGKLINDEGFLINDKNEMIDEFGNRINKDGEVIDVQEF